MFNTKKTAGIQFGQQKELCEIKLNGQVSSILVMLSTIACLIRVTVDLRELPSLEAQIDVLGTITITKIVPSASYGKHTVLPFTGLRCGYVRRGAKPLNVFLSCHVELITTLLGH